MRKLFFIIILSALVITAMFACTKKDTPDFREAQINSYDISICISKDLKEVCFNESVKIYNNSPDAWDYVVFNLYPNAYAKDAPNKAYFTELTSYGGVEIDSVRSGNSALTYEIGSNMTAMRVYLPAPLLAGDTVNVDLAGLISVPYCNLRLGLYSGILNLGGFYPILSVYENGAWREDNYVRIGDPFYAEAADYKVDIQCQLDLVVAASGDIRTERIENNYKFISTESKNIRDYAVAASYDYKIISGITNGTTVMYYYTGKTAPEKELQTAMSALDTYAKLLGSYPYRLFSVAEVYFYYGGMEYSNLVYIKNNSADKDDAIIHETAHQWFACMVGSDGINTSWLDEALVSFLTDYYYLKNGDSVKFEKLRAEAKAEYDAFIKQKRSVDADYNDRIDKSLYSYASPYEYSILVYTRGSLLFDLIYSFAGEKKFDAALSHYFVSNCFKNAAPNDLYNAFKEKRYDIAPLVDGWMNEKLVSTVISSSSHG